MRKGKNTILNRQYLSEYSPEFVGNWDQLICWDKRIGSEQGFFERLLKTYGVKSVLDVATGTGFHSVQLLKAGLEVTSLDGSREMLNKARENAEKNQLTLDIRHSDWRSIDKAVQKKYDAIICLGNSFTHLFSDSDQREVLGLFNEILNDGGLLVIDHRNYDQLLENQYSHNHKVYYCGDDVQVRPEEVSVDMTKFSYDFKESGKFFLRMYPLKIDYMKEIIEASGFTHVKTYADFKELSEVSSPQFFIHVVKKL